MGQMEGFRGTSTYPQCDLIYSSMNDQIPTPFQPEHHAGTVLVALFKILGEDSIMYKWAFKPSDIAFP